MTSRCSAGRIGCRALCLALVFSLASAGSAFAKSKKKIVEEDSDDAVAEAQDEARPEPRAEAAEEPTAAPKPKAKPKAVARDIDEEERTGEPGEKKEDPEYRYDIGVFGGYHWFTKDHILGRSKGDPTEISPASYGFPGVHLGFHFNRWIGLEAEVNWIRTSTRGAISPLDPSDPSGNTTLPPTDASLSVFGYRGSFVLHLSDNYQVQPFILAGYGAMTTLSGNSSVVQGSTIGFLHGGLGFQVGFTPFVGLRFDSRIMVPWTALSPVIPKGERIGYTGPDFEVFGGIYFNFSEVEKIRIFSKQKVIKERVIEQKRGDKDGDGIPDDVDKCPSEPEDRDGFQDQDGCPDLDNDQDGIPDVLDKCPNEPEDKDGFQDEDGCPDPDNDNDGVPDKLDKCPNEPEDKDGFQDQDGCPDPDNDNDGIPDGIDKCPNQAETVNHYQDEDGCPDEIPAEVKKFTGVIEGINFKTGSAEILPGSYAILDRALKVLQDFPDVNLEISGHTDSKGKADYNLNLSQQRASSVKLYFVSRGIASNRLSAIGFGKDRPIADNTTASGRATNRRTEFRLIDSGK